MGSTQTSEELETFKLPSIRSHWYVANRLAVRSFVGWLVFFDHCSIVPPKGELLKTNLIGKFSEEQKSFPFVVLRKPK